MSVPTKKITDFFAARGTVVKRRLGDATNTETDSKKNPEKRESEPVRDTFFEAAPSKKARNDLNTGLAALINDADWKNALATEFSKPYFKKIEAFLREQDGKGVTIYPPRHQIFNAFNFTPLKKIRVVILGQDPYHGPNQAHGLCFSVQKGVDLPGSLKNIFKELESDIPGFKNPGHGCLEKWAKNGVFLLNATLTVQAYTANSHSQIGWQQFTDSVISITSSRCDRLVYVLWGGFARKKKSLIDTKKHRVVECAHPSPLSAHNGFLGSKSFSKVNALLKELGREPIDWTLY